MADRLDALVDEALASGAVPPGVTAAERAEVEAALRAAGLLWASAQSVHDEATATLPAARARFERFLAAGGRPVQPAPVVVTAAPRSGGLGRVFDRRRAAAFAALAAALVVVAAVALVAPRLGGEGGVQTASAQVLSPGDYTQVEGVVERVDGEGDGYALLLRTYHASLRVAVGVATAGSEPGPAARPRAGDTVIVGGVVQDDLSVAASTLVPAAGGDAIPAAPAEPQPLPTAEVGAGLRARILTFALARDGAAGRVLVELEDGRRVLVRVDAPSAGRLLLRATAIGAEVTVRRGDGDLFALDVSTPSADPESGERTAPLRFTGVVTGRTANVLTVATMRGEVRVTVLPRTIVLPGDSGLDRRAIREGERLVGHAVAVAGSLGPRGQTVVADVILLGAAAGP